MTVPERINVEVQVDFALDQQEEFPKTENATRLFDTAQTSYRRTRVEHWNEVARKFASKAGWGRYYRTRLKEMYGSLIAPGQSVLELGCGRGDLVAALKPSLGVGVDFSAEMIRQGRKKYPNIRFIHGDVNELDLSDKFDVIILSDLINDLWDVQSVLTNVVRLTTPRSRIIINWYSHLWEPLIKLAEQLELAKPNLYQNWLAPEDVAGLLYLADCEVIKQSAEVLLPLPVPLLAGFANRFLVKLWPFRFLALTNFVIARPQPRGDYCARTPSVSVIVPARNEAGNIPDIVSRTPEMGDGTELVFVEGHSRDNTYAVIEATIAANPGRRCQLLRQTGVGKGDAVRMGFGHANGGILMILDADLTVPPEDLPLFYEALRSGKGEFINGVRLVYPMEKQAMRFLNLVGNKFFSLAFSWLLGQSIKDTLCGTKVLRKKDYEAIAANRSYFGDFDPFGDFDLIFGAVKLNLKLADLPIRYRERTYGTTNINRWSHGWLLLRMLVFAAKRLKFV